MHPAAPIPPAKSDSGTGIQPQPKFWTKGESMSGDELEVRIPFRKFLIGVSITLIPISLVSLYTITRTDSALRETVGANFQNIAANTARQVSAYLHDRVMQVATLAQMPEIVAATVAADKTYASVTDAAFQEKISRMEKMWNTPQSETTVKEILASPASRALRQQLKLDRRILRITLTDQRGATIAFSHKTLDYYQADEDFWQAIYAQGRGAVNLTDVLYDEVTKSNYIGIGVPVVDENTNQFLGAIDVLIDMTSILPAGTRAVQAGSPVRTLLVKDDGTVISGPDVTLSMNRKAPEFAAVQEWFQQNAGRGSGYQVAELSGGSQALIGFADTGLRQDYRNFGWLVLVVQDAHAAFASIRGVARLVWLLALVSLAGVAILAVYFSLHRRVQFDHITDEVKDVAHAAAVK